MLNTSKGPAVYSLRAQADRKKYQTGDETYIGKTKKFIFKTSRNCRYR